MRFSSFYQGFLYVVSDSDNLLIKYDINRKKIVYSLALAEISDSLNDISIEGITFDNDGNIYFAYDHKKDGAIYKYKFEFTPH